MKSFVPIMRAQRNNGNVHFEVVNFVNHTILFVDASRPSFFIDKMLQVFHLPCTCTWMLLQFKQQIGYLLDSRLVATTLDDCKFSLRLFREIYYVGHKLQLIDHSHNVFFALQTRKFRMGAMSLSNIVLNSLHIATIRKKRIARWAHLVGVSLKGWFQKLSSQPIAVSARKRQAFNISPKFACCCCCHNDNLMFDGAKVSKFSQTVNKNKK